jgi:hypothetical protein
VDAGFSWLERQCKIQDKIAFIEAWQYDKPMRWAKSYSIVDHQLLHGGYLHRLRHTSMGLYLFLVVVGDKNGRSFYADTTIMQMVRLSERELTHARLQLIQEGLIDYQRPYWWVKSIQRRQKHARTKHRTNQVSAGCQEADFPADRRVDRDFAKKCLKDLSRMLSE